MNIRENRKFNFKLNMPNFKKLLFGSEDGIIGFTLTLGISIIAIIFGSLVFYFNNNGIESYLNYVNNAVFISSGAGTILSLIALIASSEFSGNNNNGWSIWRRVIIFHFFISASIMIFNTIQKSEIRESATKLEFISSNVKDCKYGVRMTSKNLTYLFCSDYESEYEKLAKADKSSISLVGLNTSSVTADHYEYIELSK